jgi:hemerythrin superfamily protein
MNVVELLKDDHRIVEKLFETYEENPQRADVPAILRQVAEALTLHTEVEEEILYPEARRSLQDGEDRVKKALAEHAKVAELIEEIESRSGKSDDTSEKIGSLKAAVEHHVEEEEAELFPALEDALDEERLEQLGEEILKKKREGAGSMPSARRKLKRDASPAASPKSRRHARGSSAGVRQKNSGSRRRTTTEP